jgi:bile acid:Na+ symporter, BASS family
MLETLIWLSGVLLPIFIFCTMANVDMTQDPMRIVAYWKNWPFYFKMLLANFVAAPTIMYLLLQFVAASALV